VKTKLAALSEAVWTPSKVTWSTPSFRCTTAFPLASSLILGFVATVLNECAALDVADENIITRATVEPIVAAIAEARVADIADEDIVINEGRVEVRSHSRLGTQSVAATTWFRIELIADVADETCFASGSPGTESRSGPGRDRHAPVSCLPIECEAEEQWTSLGTIVGT
jgi:hypothetical protein